MNKKMKQALDRKELLDFDNLFNSYPKKRKEKILQKARYLKAAIALKKLRKEFNFSQQKMAEKMNVERAFVSRIESGRQNITLETFYRAAEAVKKDFVFKFR